MTFERLIENIDDMPQLSDIARVMQSFYSLGIDHVDMKKLVRMIESDVMLTANILKMINSPYYGFKNKISSVPQAVTLFGTQKIYGLVIHFAMSNQLKADTAIYGFNNAQFNEMCIIQSSLMMQWYAKVNLRDTHILTSLALIMESGKLIVSKELHGSDYIEVYREGFLACTNIQDFEREFLGTTSYYLSAILFSHWNLEPVYAEVLRELDLNEQEKASKENDKITKKYAAAIEVIRTAVNLKEVLTDESIKKACVKVQEMGLDSEHFEAVALRIKKRVLKD
ncbi:HDOD domain-containing protein [Candidatus Sulfurimonas baltica]|uniref:HDOD domain-containing protein n=1 Tax=Candidatus Sulfurimonas baltica TaxID=2740404 RepID=A0A7S7RNJ7_9BACT|nr:HDOD domain-containing protein [Candidatus Sulfurimonas baltica]QOY52515.1 HDOD domain-containing protein [Candidatus Sulfurimonas baltica]